MKDECAGVPIIEFCGLRSKMYSYIKENCKYCCKAKGIKKNVVVVVVVFFFFLNVYLYSYLLHVYLSVILVLYILNISLSLVNTQ